MRRALLALSLTAAAAGPSHAASSITETINGVVAGQYVTDTAGDFGPVGANLSGSPLTVKFAYVPVDYNIQIGCAHGYPCKTYEALGTKLVPKSVSISTTINGHTLVFTPTVSSLITLFTDGSNLFLINSDPGDSAANSGVQVSLELKTQPVFGAEISPTNPPLKQPRGDLFEVFPQNSQAANEIISFTVTSSTR